MTSQRARLLLAGYFGPGSGNLIEAYLSLGLGRKVTKAEADEIVKLATHSDDPKETYGGLIRSE